jgi:hypothetical protein
MQPHDYDDCIRRERPSGVPTDVTADDLKSVTLDGPLPDVDVRAKWPGYRRLLVFAAVGAASGFALALFGYVGCHAAAAVSNSDPPDLGEILGQCFLAVAPIAGGFLGLLLELYWRVRPSKASWDD